MKLAPELTELVLILDRSGSMSGLEADTIGGCNALIGKQKQEPGDALVTTVLFDDRYELLHDMISLKLVEPLTNEQYYVRGTTALNDAIGKTIAKISEAHAHAPEAARPQKTLVAIITDGKENASNEYGGQQVKQLIEARKKAGWEFLFIGANIDAVTVAREVGIQAERAVQYHADAEGIVASYEAINAAVSQVRKGKPLDNAWREDIDKDFESRKRRK